MLKMRLQRIGRRNDPSYRVVVTDSRRGPKSGDNVDTIGSYSPKMNNLQIDGEKAKEWIAKGVQVSDTVHNLLVGQKIIEGKKVNALPKKAPIVSETEEAPAAEATPAAQEGAAEETAEESAPEAPAEEAAPEEEKAEEAAPGTEEAAPADEEEKKE